MKNKGKTLHKDEAKQGQNKGWLVPTLPTFSDTKCLFFNEKKIVAS